MFWAKSVIAGLMAILLVATMACAPAAAPASNPTAPSAAAAPAAAPIKLKAASMYPDANDFVGKCLKYFEEQVTKRTNGRVTFDTYWSSSLTQAAESLDFVGKGGADILHNAIVYWPDRLMLINGLAPVFTFNDQDKLLLNFNEFYRNTPAFRDAEDKRGNVKWLFFGLVDTLRLQSTKKVASLADLKGMKIRTSGMGADQILTPVGAVSVSLPAAEVVEALKRGTIDGVFFSNIFANSYKLPEVSKYVSTANLGTSVANGIGINVDTWNKLPPDVQAVMTEVSKELPQLGTGWLKTNITEAETAMKAAGVQFVEFPQADMKAWMDKSPDFLAQWATNMEGKGYPQAKQWAEQFKQWK